MGDVFIALSMSLDGFVAGPNDEIDPLHDYPVPFFIVSHDVPGEMAAEDAPFTFVTEGVETAIDRAHSVAGAGKVSLMGADVPQRLFDHLERERIDLERTAVVAAPEGITHLSFRVLK